MPKKLTREDFEKRYWGKGAATVPASTRREFYSDYRESGMAFDKYKASTSQPIQNGGNREFGFRRGNRGGFKQIPWTCDGCGRRKRGSACCNVNLAGQKLCDTCDNRAMEAKRLYTKIKNPAASYLNMVEQAARAVAAERHRAAGSSYHGDNERSLETALRMANSAGLGAEARSVVRKVLKGAPKPRLAPGDAFNRSRARALRRKLGGRKAHTEDRIFVRNPATQDDLRTLRDALVANGIEARLTKTGITVSLAHGGKRTARITPGPYTGAAFDIRFSDGERGRFNTDGTWSPAHAARSVFDALMANSMQEAELRHQHFRTQNPRLAGRGNLPSLAWTHWPIRYAQGHEALKGVVKNPKSRSVKDRAILLHRWMDRQEAREGEYNFKHAYKHKAGTPEHTAYSAESSRRRKQAHATRLKVAALNREMGQGTGETTAMVRGLGHSIAEHQRANPGKSSHVRIGGEYYYGIKGGMGKLKHKRFPEGHTRMEEGGRYPAVGGIIVYRRPLSDVDEQYYGLTNLHKADLDAARSLYAPVPRKPNPSFKPSTKKPSTMTAGAIGKELDKINAQRTVLMHEGIAAGRGHERPSDRRHMTDPLSLACNTLDDRHFALRREVEARYGPRAPDHLPRGYGPREKA